MCHRTERALRRRQRGTAISVDTARDTTGGTGGTRGLCRVTARFGRRLAAVGSRGAATAGRRALPRRTRRDSGRPGTSDPPSRSTARRWRRSHRRRRNAVHWLPLQYERCAFVPVVQHCALLVHGTPSAGQARQAPNGARVSQSEGRGRLAAIAGLGAGLGQCLTLCGDLRGQRAREEKRAEPHVRRCARVLGGALAHGRFKNRSVCLAATLLNLSYWRPNRLARAFSRSRFCSSLSKARPPQHDQDVDQDEHQYQRAQARHQARDECVVRPGRRFGRRGRCASRRPPRSVQQSWVCSLAPPSARRLVRA